MVVGEEDEGRRHGGLLALEEHGSGRTEQQQRGQGPVAARAGEAVEAFAARRVGDLVVVLEVEDESGPRQVESRRAAPLPLPAIALPLVQRTELGGRQQLPRRSPEVAV